MYEALEVDPSRRMVARTRGELMPPGCCKICGNGDTERTYLDFGIFVDYEGSWYICNVCFNEAAVEVMGYFTREEHLQLLGTNNQLVDQIEKLQAELDSYGSLNEVLGRFGLSATSINDLPRIPSLPVPVEDGKGSEDGEPKTPKPSNGKGSTNTSRSKSRDGDKPIIS